MGSGNSKNEFIDHGMLPAKLTQKEFNSAMAKWGYSDGVEFDRDYGLVAASVSRELLGRSDVATIGVSPTDDDIKLFITMVTIVEESNGDKPSAATGDVYYVRVKSGFNQRVATLVSSLKDRANAVKWGIRRDAAVTAAKTGVAVATPYAKAMGDVAAQMCLQAKASGDLNGQKAFCGVDAASKIAAITSDTADIYRARAPTAGSGLSYVTGSGDGCSCDAAQLAYRGAAEHYAARDKIGGDEMATTLGGSCGCSTTSFIGGNEIDMTVVREYESTLNSFTKQKLVADLVDALKRAGLKKDIPADASYDDQIAMLTAAVPNSKKSRGGFKQNAESHERVCKVLASAINSSIGKEVIDVNAKPAVVCQAVAELVTSLSTGMHVEFMVVHENIRKVLKNIQVLREQFDLLFNPLVEGIANSGDSKLIARTANNRALAKLVTEEFDRQIEMLKNLLSVTLTPAEVKLKTIIKEGHELSGLIEKINYKPGESQFGDLLSTVLTNVSLTAEYALVVDRALKTVGVTLREYSESPNLRALISKVSETLLNANMSDEQLYEFLQSAELLYKNFYRSKDIEKLLSSKNNISMSGSSDSTYEGSSSFLDVYDDVSGGATESDFRKTTMDRRIENKKAVKTLIFSTFSKAVDEHMMRVMRALDGLASKVGVSIKLSDELDGFRGALDKLKPLLQRSNAYLSLLGYYGDALSKERRDSFIGQLNLIKSYSDSMAAMPMYSSVSAHFKEVSSSIASLKSTVEQFSDKISAKYGGDDVSGAADSDDDSDSDGKCLSLDRVGGASGLSSMYAREYDSNTPWKAPGQGVVKGIPRSLGEIITKFDYMYKVAQIKENLANNSKETAHYSEQYENMRGEAIAKKIDAIKKDCKEKLAFLTFDGSEKSGLSQADFDAVKALYDPAHPGIGDAAKQARIKVISSVAKATEEHCRVRENFWRTIEAVDEYMRVFTNDIAKNPNSAQDIKAILDETEVISDWYTANTGKLIHTLFDSFPAALNGAGGAAVMPDPAIYAGTPHYYSNLAAGAGAVSANAANATYPGNPYIVVEPSEIDSDSNGFGKYTMMKKITRNLSLLKNILSVFVHVGSAFGDSSIYKKVFMTPTQIYRNLCEWMEICSFGVGGAAVANIPDSATAANRDFRTRFGMYMRGVNVGQMPEDKFFAYIIKSMCSKVLTVVGMYDLFQRPDEVLSYSQVRYMIGGSETPAIESRAVELYLRLPLLAEFYRDLFNFYSLEITNPDFITNTERQTQREKIAMLPEVEGNFSGLIKLVFNHARNFKLQDYSDVELKELIAEVNAIWNRMAGSGDENAVNNILRAFVNEINARYGIITQRERNAYNNEFGQTSAYMRTRDDDLDNERETDIPLLPGEEDLEYERDAIAPSKKFERVGEGFDKLNPKQSPYFISEHHATLVNRLRCALDAYFHDNTSADAWDRVGNKGDPAAGKYGVGQSFEKPSTLRPGIKIARMRLQAEQNTESRFKIVSSMIRGSSLISKADHIKHAMFHETVVSGLNVLSAVYTIIARYHLLILATDVTEIAKMAPFNVAAADAAPAVAIRSSLEAKHITPAGVGAYNPFSFAFKDAYVVAGGKPAGTGSTAVDATLSRTNIASDLIEGIFSVSKDLQGLVNVNIDDDRISVNFSRLREYCMKMLEHVKYFIELMRGSVDETLILRYTDKMRVGSLYWLQEQLVEKMFEGREANTGNVGYTNLDNLNLKLKRTLEWVVKSGETYWGNVVAKIVSYDNELTNGGLSGGNGVDANQPTSNIDFTQPINKLFMLDQGAKQIVYPDFSNRFAQLYDFGDNYTNNNSLLFGFNQLVAKYIALCYDTSAEKIYSGTISHLVNSAVNSAIVDLNRTYPDMVRKETGIRLMSATGGPVDPLAIRFMNQIDAAVDASALDVAKAALIEVYPGNNAAIGALTNASSGDAVRAAVGNNKVPEFVVDLVRDPVGAGGKAAGKRYYDTYYKNASSFIIGNDNAVNKDIPTVVKTSGGPGTVFGVRADPNPNNILYTSLALILKNLLTSKNSANQNPIYLIDNLAEVSMFKKEAMRANLPTMRALFLTLQQKSEYMKQILALRGLVYTRAVGAGAQTIVGLGSTGVAAVAAGAAAAKVELTTWQSLSTSISNACTSMLTCIDGVMRELADTPKYLELYAGSISEYKSTNGTDPFMPLSTALYCLRNNGATDVLPHTTVGTDGFKLSYGTRGLLNTFGSAVSAANVPGWTQFVDMYNAMSVQRDQADTKKTDSFFETLTTLLRYAHNVRNIKGAVCSLTTDDFDSSNAGAEAHQGAIARTAFVDDNSGVFAMAPLVAPARREGNRFPVAIISTGTNTGARTNNAPAFAFTSTLSALVDLTSNADKSKKMEELATAVAGDQPHNTNLAVVNVIDMNIIPINVHALMRDVPLANLYNYSYTFDRLLIELFYGINDDFANLLIWRLCQEPGVGSIGNVTGHAGFANNTGTAEQAGRGAIRAALQTAEPLIRQDAGAAIADIAAASGAAGPSLAVLYKGVVAATNIGAGANYTAAAKAAFDAAAATWLALYQSSQKSMIKSSKEMFVALLLDPYRAVNDDTGYEFFKDICRGDSNIPLGRPKFLGDQLLNKLLFGEMYENDGAFTNQRGPTRRGNVANELTFQRDIESRRNASEALDGNRALDRVALTQAQKNRLQAAGRDRFNTVFVRNLVFLTNSYRTLLHRLRKDLTYNKSAILSSIAATREENTEFSGDQRIPKRAQDKYERRTGQNL